MKKKKLKQTNASAHLIQHRFKMKQMSCRTFFSLTGCRSLRV